MKKKRVLVAMSGGVDSTVTACLLMKKGFDVVGVHMRLWKDDGGKTGTAHVEKMARKIGIPLILLDLKTAFKKRIVDEFLRAYSEGKTPNPCVQCNRLIKFGLLIEKMKELKADYLATGHYMQIGKKKTGKKTVYELFQAKDCNKDQSYFLYALSQRQLRHILFPLGKFTKPHVRGLAKQFGLDELNSLAESQNLCFVSGETDQFIRKYLQKKFFKKGKIITTTGAVIGEHEGLPLYTIGQRKGIGIGGIKGEKNGEPLYVVKLDYKNNNLVVGSREHLLKDQLLVNGLSFIDGKKMKNGTRVLAAIRYRSQKVSAVFYSGKKKDAGLVKFIEPVRAVTPGQSVVFYKGKKVLGGGIIA